MSPTTRRTALRATLGLVAAGGLALATLASARPAYALPDPRDLHKIHKKIHDKVHDRVEAFVEGHHPRFPSVPRFIGRTNGVHYRSYYQSRAWFGPHRHSHVVYRFPIHVGGRIVYRPYTYCGDRLFVMAPAPRFALAPPPPPRIVVVAPRPVYVDHDDCDHHDHDGDRYDDRRYDRYDDHDDDRDWDDD